MVGTETVYLPWVTTAHVDLNCSPGLKIQQQSLNPPYFLSHLATHDRACAARDVQV